MNETSMNIQVRRNNISESKSQLSLSLMSALFFGMFLSPLSGGSSETLRIDDVSSDIGFSESWEQKVPAGARGHVLSLVRNKLLIPEASTLRQDLLISTLLGEDFDEDGWINLARGLIESGKTNEEYDLVAFNYFDKAANKGVAEGYLEKAKLAIQGRVKITDPSELQSFLISASARGLGEADFYLAKLLQNEDPKSAFGILENGVLKNNPMCEMEVGSALINGVWEWETGELPITPDPEKGKDLLIKSFYSGELEAGEVLLYDAIDNNDLDSAKVILAGLLDKSMQLGEESWIDSIPELIESGRIPRDLYIEAANEVSRKNGIAKLILDAVELGENPLAIPGLEFQEIEVLGRRRMSDVEIELRGSDDECIVNLIGVPLSTEVVAEGIVKKVIGSRVEVDLSLLPSANRLGSPLNSYYLEVPGEGNEGYPIEIEPKWGFSTKIPLAESVEDVIAIGDKVSIRKWRTLFGLFGEFNKVGLKPGASSAEADNIILFEASNQTARTYFFHSIDHCWYEEGFGPIEADVLLYPWEGILVRRKEPAPIFLSIKGESTDPSGYAELYPGTNFLSNRGEWGRRLALLELNDAQSTRVRDAVVVEVVPNDNDWRLVQTYNDWWKPVGLSESDRLFVATQSVLILSEDVDSKPYIIDNK